MLVSFLVGLVGAFVASWLAYRTAIAVVQRRIQQAKSGSVVSLQIDEAVKVVRTRNDPLPLSAYGAHAPLA